MSNKTAIIIDSMVNDQKTINDSLMDDVIVCNTGDDVLSLNGVTRLGYMFHNEFNCKIPDIQLKSTTQKKNVPKSPKGKSAEYKFYPKNLVELLTKLGSGVTLDIISCNMNSAQFVNERILLSAKLGVKIEYSVNQTGNGTDADWVLESNSENLVGIYFTSNILTWQFTLATLNTTVYDNPNAILNYFNGTLANSLSYHDNKYKLHQDITLNNYIDNKRIHIQLNNKQVFDGNKHTITLSNTTSGLFVFDSTSLETTVKNLTIITPNILVNGSAFVKNNQSYFTIDNCISNSIINTQNYTSTSNTGGIVGAYCCQFVVKNCTNNSIITNYSGGISGAICDSFKIINCKNNIIISDNYQYVSEDSGGIVGANSSNFKVIRCVNYRNIINYSAGIVGTACYKFSVIKCKNYGILSDDIYNNNSGIVGYLNNDFNVYKCINYGNINSSNSTGIVSNESINFKIIKCTNKGSINEPDCGGIVGTINSFASFAKIISCVNNGNITGSSCGGITSSNFGNNINAKLEIIKCKNYGSVLQNDNDNGGICGPKLGLVEYTNGAYNTILLKNCWTKYGNLVSTNTLQNDTLLTNFGKNNNNVYTKLTIEQSYTREKVPLVAGFGSNTNTVSAIYLKESGKKVNLLNYTTFISHKYEL